MKNVFKKIDWFQIGVLSLGVAATIAKSIYENKRFDADLDKKYEEHFEKRVNELIDKKLNK